MLQDYIKIAWRSFWRSRLLTAVNIVGLSFAFPVSILLALTAFREDPYDKFHRNHGLQQLYIFVHQSQGLEERPNMPMPLIGPLSMHMHFSKAFRYISTRTE